MAYFKKKPTYCHTTEADRERLKKLDEASDKPHRKFKALLTLVHPKVKAVICKYIYGKNKNDIEAKAKEDIIWFQKKDKTWKLSKLEFLKGENPEGNESAD